MLLTEYQYFVLYTGFSFRTEVRSLETPCLGSCDIERVLELGVEDIE